MQASANQRAYHRRVGRGTNQEHGSVARQRFSPSVRRISRQMRDRTPAGARAIMGWATRASDEQLLAALQLSLPPDPLPQAAKNVLGQLLNNLAREIEPPVSFGEVDMRLLPQVSDAAVQLLRSDPRGTMNEFRERMLAEITESNVRQALRASGDTEQTEDLFGRHLLRLLSINGLLPLVNTRDAKRILGPIDHEPWIRELLTGDERGHEHCEQLAAEQFAMHLDELRELKRTLVAQPKLCREWAARNPRMAATTIVTLSGALLKTQARSRLNRAASRPERPDGTPDERLWIPPGHEEGQQWRIEVEAKDGRVERTLVISRFGGRQRRELIDSQTAEQLLAGGLDKDQALLTMLDHLRTDHLPDEPSRPPQDSKVRRRQRRNASELLYDPRGFES